MKLKRFYIQYREKGSRIWLNLQRYKASTGTEALVLAKVDWIKHWNLSFPHLNNGEQEVEKIDFEIINK